MPGTVHVNPRVFNPMFPHGMPHTNLPGMNGALPQRGRGHFPPHRGAPIVGQMGTPFSGRGERVPGSLLPTPGPDRGGRGGHHAVGLSHRGMHPQRGGSPYPLGMPPNARGGFTPPFMGRGGGGGTFDVSRGGRPMPMGRPAGTVSLPHFSSTMSKNILFLLLA